MDNYQADIEQVDHDINLKANLEDAMSFINYNIKEGIYAPEDFEGMTPEQLIEFYHKEEARAQGAYDSSREE